MVLISFSLHHPPGKQVSLTKDPVVVVGFYRSVFCTLRTTDSVFDLARRIAPKHYIRAAGYWWWGAIGSGQDLDRALGPQIHPLGVFPLWLARIF